MPPVTGESAAQERPRANKHLGTNQEVTSRRRGGKSITPGWKRSRLGVDLRLKRCNQKKEGKKVVFLIHRAAGAQLVQKKRRLVKIAHFLKADVICLIFA